MPASPAQNVEISYHAAVLDAAAVRDGSCRRPRRRLPPPQPARVLTTHRQEGYGICACRHVPCRTSHPDQPSCVLPPTLDAEMPRGAPGSAHSAATAPTAPTPTSGIPPARRGRRHQRCGATVIRSDLRALKVAAAIAGAAFSSCPPPPSRSPYDPAPPPPTAGGGSQEWQPLRSIPSPGRLLACGSARGRQVRPRRDVARQERPH